MRSPKRIRLAAKSLAKTGRMDWPTAPDAAPHEFTQGRFNRRQYDHVSQYTPSPLDALS